MKTLNRVLITGASGFIGSHLARRLVQEGFEVGVIIREKSNPWRIEDILDKVSIYDADIKNTQNILKIFSDFGPEAVYHLAAYYAVEHQTAEVPLMVDANILGTLNLLEASKESEVGLFVNTSSCFVYRPSEVGLKENAALEPLNLYALTKIHAEQACKLYSDKYGLRSITFRLFPPYGPADNGKRLIPYAIKSMLDGKRPAMTTGRQMWDFVYVGDIVDAYLRLLSISELPKGHEIFNIGTGNAVSIRDVVSMIQEILGTDVEPEWGAVPHRNNELWFTCADMSKTEKFLRWKPKTDVLNEGLRMTVEWYRNFWEKRGKNGE